MTNEPIGCEAALQMMAAFIDRELSTADDRSMHVHLETCRSCYSRSEFERQLKDRLASLREGTVDASLGNRIQGIIGQFNRSGNADRSP